MDLLILIAATAVGLGGIKALSPHIDFYLIPYTPISSPSLLNLVSVLGSRWASYASSVLAAWMLGLVVLRLRRPRPGLRRLVSEPGWAASCEAVGILAGAVMAAIGVDGRYNIQFYFDLSIRPRLLSLAGWGLARGRIVGQAVLPDSVRSGRRAGRPT